VVGACGHRRPHIRPKTRFGNNGIAHQQLPVDPGRAARRYLCIHAEV
jgi:hypothetical protein